MLPALDGSGNWLARAAFFLMLGTAVRYEAWFYVSVVPLLLGLRWLHIRARGDPVTC